jgi:acid stress-induced BolA-like protein IbaG/YrbA
MPCAPGSLRNSSRGDMIQPVLTAEELRAILLRLEGVHDVQISAEGRKFVAFVQASRFQGMEEGARQVEVWRLLRDALAPDQLDQVEFVFTDTPEERRETDAGGRT